MTGDPSPNDVRQEMKPFISLFDTINARFDGPCYQPAVDQARLTGQLKRVYDLMADGVWRTLQEIADITHDPHASISAQLRHLRKPRHGSFTIEKRRRGDPSRGLWEYRLADGDRGDRDDVDRGVALR